ncbi:hypothetical protein [Flavobacterium sp.]|uniref:hypothetical protein n=1 Tax=Flavobacterium sp. TaxID=239 RepID=UPI0025C260B7|nr:hypothetical protein [Flavobacterium sp.]
MVTSVLHDGLKSIATRLFEPRALFIVTPILYDGLKSIATRLAEPTALLSLHPFYTTN